MAEARINLTTIPPLRPLLDAVVAVADKWADMSRCYSSADEARELAELLDTLDDAVREMRRNG